MDSFVLAETFKYLYLLFSEESEREINIHDYIFTTEAHLLPLYLSTVPSDKTANDTTENENASLYFYFLEFCFTFECKVKVNF